MTLPFSQWGHVALPHFQKLPNIFCLAVFAPSCHQSLHAFLLEVEAKAVKALCPHEPHPADAGLPTGGPHSHICL